MSAEELARILDLLGERLGPAGEHAFRLAVQYHVTSSLVWVLATVAVMAVMAFICGAAARLTVNRWRAETAAYADGKGKSYRDGPDLMDYLFPWMLGGALGGMVFISVAALCISSLITLVNPEYAAIRDLLGRVKP